MHSVKAERTGISASQFADVILDELGASCHVKEGPDELKIRKGAFSRAQIVLSYESGETATCSTWPWQFLLQRYLPRRADCCR
jgi:hypothetical protein